MDALQNSAFIKILKETFTFHNLRPKKIKPNLCLISKIKNLKPKAQSPRPSMCMCMWIKQILLYLDLVMSLQLSTI